MTLEEVKAMEIRMTKDLTLALCKKTKTGKSMPVRPITGEESAAITAALYALFKIVKPNEKYLTIPFGDGKVLAITEVDVSEASK